MVANCQEKEFKPELLAIVNVSLEMNKTGWSFFTSESNPSATPKEQMRAVGFAEGAIFTE